MTGLRLLCCWSLGLATVVLAQDAAPPPVLELPTESETVWVQVIFDIGSDDGVDYYYYSGRLERATYDSIIDNRASGFITLRDVRFQMDDRYYPYADERDEGVLSVRADTLRWISLLKGDPLLTQDQADAQIAPAPRVEPVPRAEEEAPAQFSGLRI